MLIHTVTWYNVSGRYHQCDIITSHDMMDHILFFKVNTVLTVVCGVGQMFAAVQPSTLVQWKRCVGACWDTIDSLWVE